MLFHCMHLRLQKYRINYSHKRFCSTDPELLKGAEKSANKIIHRPLFYRQNIYASFKISFTFLKHADPLHALVVTKVQN